jgi:hypothetical protein
MDYVKFKKTCKTYTKFIDCLHATTRRLTHCATKQEKRTRTAKSTEISSILAVFEKTSISSISRSTLAVDLAVDSADLRQP